MGDSSGNIDVAKLISYSDDLVAVLNEKRDINILNQCLDQSKSLQSYCHSEYTSSRNLLEDYEKRIEECKQKMENAKLEVSKNAEVENLQKELEVEREKERLLLEEIRAVNNEINDLDKQRIFIEEKRRIMEKLKKEETRARRKLSMYASVTNTILNMDENSKIIGTIVDKEKVTIEKFEVDLTNGVSFDTCQSIWKMINQQ